MGLPPQIPLRPERHREQGSLMQNERGSPLGLACRVLLAGVFAWERQEQPTVCHGPGRGPRSPPPAAQKSRLSPSLGVSAA